PEWVSYLETQWINQKERWGQAWRKECTLNIDTNNYIESWHRDLKVNYIKRKRRQRVDYLVFLLTRQVLPDYRRKVLRILLGFE
ncbi:hypothetical protein BT69DRAFT_1195799, partial [Atractiella rhizophila]